MPNLPLNCFLRKLQSKVINTEKRWYSNDGKRIYTWDFTHEDVEIYNKRGYHLGSADAITGETYKPAVKGRKINV